jgi:hypothetical protein
VYHCGACLAVALATFFTFSADTVKKDFIDQKYQKLRIFQYGGMGFNATLASNSPTWVTRMGTAAEDPLNGWYNASHSTYVPPLKDDAEALKKPPTSLTKSAFDSM